jgi:hypothetical protein
VVITAVSNHDHNLPLKASAVQLIEGTHHAIPECSFSIGLEKFQILLKLIEGVAAINDNSGTIANGDNVELVVRIGSGNKLCCSNSRILKPRSHASARIKDNGEGNWRVLMGKILHRLGDFVFEEHEVLRRKVRHWSVSMVQD